MFISAKRHEREKQELLDASNRLTEALLEHSDQGLFLLDAEDRVRPQVSRSLALLFRRKDFNNLSFEKLVGPLLTAKTLTLVRSHIARLLDTAPTPQPAAAPLGNLEVRLPDGKGGFDSAYYSFDFHALDGEPALWLVRVKDVTREVQCGRELEELQIQVQTQGEILRGVLSAGGARFAAFLQRVDAAMKTINAVLKKPAREQEAFRAKLEEALEEVDRVRRDAAVFKLSALEAAARQFEDSLQDLRAREGLSGSDFLPLALKLDQLFGQFAALKSMSAELSQQPVSPSGVPVAHNMTENGTQIIQAPTFMASMPAPKAPPAPGTSSSAPAGSLENTLRSLTEHVAEEHQKAVVLDVQGLSLVPGGYQAAVKNIAIQLIRNAVMHGIEKPAEREAHGKPAHGTLRLEFKRAADGGFELQFEDDGCGLDPDQVRATAIARGVVGGEAAARLRDRETIKLIFKSAYSTMKNVPGEPAHGSGLSLVRRYVHEAGGKIAIASLLGHETRFKVTLPVLADAVAAMSGG